MREKTSLQSLELSEGKMSMNYEFYANKIKYFDEMNELIERKKLSINSRNS